MGNGLLGNLVYFDKNENVLYMEVCNGLVCDKRENEIGTAEYDRPRLPIGHFLVRPKGKILSCNLRLDLFNAALKVILKPIWAELICSLLFPQKQ